MTGRSLDWNDVTSIPLPGTLAGGMGSLGRQGARTTDAGGGFGSDHSHHDGLGSAAFVGTGGGLGFTASTPGIYHNNSSNYGTSMRGTGQDYGRHENRLDNNNNNWAYSVSSTNADPTSTTRTTMFSWNRDLSGLQVASQNLLDQTAAAAQDNGAVSGASVATARPPYPVVEAGNGGGGLGRMPLSFTGTTAVRPPRDTTPSSSSFVVPGSMGDGRQQLGNSSHNTMAYYYNNPVANTNTTSTATSLKVVLAQQEQDIMDQILRVTSHRTQQETNQRMEQQVQMNWDEEREVWAQHSRIGTRTLGGARSAWPSSSMAAAATWERPLLSDVNTGRLEADPSASALAMIPVTSSTSVPTSAGAWTTSRANFQQHQQLDTNQAKAHLALLNRIDTDLQGSVEELGQLSHQLSLSSSTSSALTHKGYDAAWRLVARLISIEAATSSPTKEARAALAHLCSQFREMVILRNRQVAAAVAARAGRLHNSGDDDDDDDMGRRGRLVQYRSDTANHCDIFVTDTIGTTTTDGNNPNAPPPPPSSPGAAMCDWPVVYYCLRCGDAVAAWEVLQQQQQQQSAGAVVLQDSSMMAVHRILSSMAQAQQQKQHQHEQQSDRSSSYNLWDFGGPGLVNESDRHLVRDLFERAVRNDRHNRDGGIPPKNLHQMGVYALLSGMERLPQSESVPGFNTIEDYLTGTLWHAVMNANDPVEELVRLGDSIESFGAGYFDDDNESGGWAFASPLFICQRYEHALLHLTNTGGPMGLLQATHLGLVLTHSGYVIRDLGSPVTNARKQDQNGVITSLLVAYSNQLLAEPSLGPVAALQYLVRIPNKSLAHQEVAQLIAKTRDIQQLVGAVTADGLRERGGALDLRLPAVEVSLVLGEAAELLLMDKDNLQNSASAAMCLMLAERYADVLLLLNGFLSPPNRPDSHRAFWIQQSESFHSCYLSKRTHVFDVLEREGRTSLIGTSRMMLQLNQFFALHQARRYDEAWSIADRLNLIPLTSADLPVKESLYLGLDPVVQKAVPALLVSIMEMMYHEHAQLKRSNVAPPALQPQDGTGAGSSVARERRRQLQERAKLCVTLSGLVGMTNEDIDNLSRLQSLMV